MYSATISSARYNVFVRMRVVETPEFLGGDYGGFGSEMARSGSGELTVHDAITGELVAVMIAYYSRTGTDGMIRPVEDESFRKCIEESRAVKTMLITELADALIHFFRATREGVGIPRISLEEAFRA